MASTLFFPLITLPAFRSFVIWARMEVAGRWVTVTSNNTQTHAYVGLSLRWYALHEGGCGGICGFVVGKAVMLFQSTWVWMKHGVHIRERLNSYQQRSFWLPTPVVIIVLGWWLEEEVWRRFVLGVLSKKEWKMNRNWILHFISVGLSRFQWFCGSLVVETSVFILRFMYMATRCKNVTEWGSRTWVACTHAPQCNKISFINQFKTFWLFVKDWIDILACSKEWSNALIFIVSVSIMFHVGPTK